MFILSLWDSITNANVFEWEYIKSMAIWDRKSIQAAGSSLRTVKFNGKYIYNICRYMYSVWSEKKWKLQTFTFAKYDVKMEILLSSFKEMMNFINNKNKNKREGSTSEKRKVLWIV